MTIVATILAMFVLPRLQSGAFAVATGVLLIALAPTLFISKAAMQPGERSRQSITLGYVAYTIILFTSSLVSGLATLLFLPLMFLMGLSAMQATALRRALLLVQAAISFCIVLPQGYIVWGHALACLAGCYIGGYIGTSIALKRGEKFVKYCLAGVMVISGILLIVK